ncbi:MAG: rod shape-determining protein RodA [Alphaproteobacteria bacterium]
MARTLGLHHEAMTLGQKFRQIIWSLVLLLAVTAAIGFAMLYSAANGNFDPWAWRQAVRFGAMLLLLVAIALVDVRLLLRWSYVIYAAALAMLALVEVMGVTGMGAQRWVDLWLFRLQPSEVMKVALVLAVARYFHCLTLDDTRRLHNLLVPLLMMAAPVALVLRQPDLGTAVMLILTSVAVMFAAGVRMRVFVAAGVSAIAAVPLGWQFLRDYQKQRIYTFLDPENDPLGAGYHILQSKIALGSGGMFGKGFLNGSQSHLSFLPERQTDFIFTMLAEEFGLAGALMLLGLYVLILIYGIAISLWSKSQYGRLVAIGVTTTFFVYVFINIAMVTGLIPVVGVPLPLVSYGGTAMMTIMVGAGVLVSVYVHRDVEISRGEGLV